MESTKGDMEVVGEMLIQPQRREVVVPRDPGLQGLHQSASSDDDDDDGMDIKNNTNDNGDHNIVTKADTQNFGKSVYFEEDTGIWKCRHCIWTYGKGNHPRFNHIHQYSFTNFRDSTDEWSLSKTNNGLAESDEKQNISDANQDVLKDNEISPEISEEKEIKAAIPPAKVKSKPVKLENLIEESDEDEDVIELEFEREINKMETHTMHCPKCNASITKVVLRKKRTKKGLSAVHNTPQTEPVDLLGCLSCCSVFVPSGNCFSWIRLLANGGEDSAEISQETDVAASALTGDNGNMVIDKEGDCFSLFRIFGNKPEKKITQKPLQQSSSDPAHAGGDTIINKEDGHAQNGDGKHDVIPFLLVDQNVVLPVQNGSASINQNGNASVNKNGVGVSSPNHQNGGGGASVNKNGVGVSSPNHQNGKYSGFPKPLLSTAPVDWNIDLGQDIANVPNGNDTSVGEEAGANGIINVHPGEIPDRMRGTQESKSLEIVKSIVYGGLMEFITSLSIVSSAAASGATTSNLLTIGLANLIGGLIIIGHNLRDLKNDQCEGASNKYQEQLGKKENFLLHATFAVLSFLVFGLIPPATYGYAFHKMNDKNLTLVAVAIASLLCIITLASCKAYIMKSDKFSMYIKTIMYYVCMTVMVSGVSYEVGDLINKFMENYGWLEATPAFPLSLPGVKPRNPVAWTSY